MDEILTSFQKILIFNKDKEKEIYNECLKSLKNLRECESIVNNLKKLKLDIDDENQVEEDELKKLPDLFHIKDFQSFEYEQVKEILLKSIVLQHNKQLCEVVYKKLLKNLEEENQIVSLTSLYALLYYFYKKYDSKALEMEYNLNEFFDSDLFESNKNSDEFKVFEHLKRLLNAETNLLKIQAHKLCHNLDIPLSMSKMLEFATEFPSLESVNNLVIFIGSTGVGKSTLINYLTGTEYELLEDDDFLVPKEGYFNKLKCTDQNTRHSETLYCEVIPLNESKKLYFADVPGFFDTRTNKSIIAALGFPLLIKKTEKLKALVILLDYVILNPNSGNRGEEFEKISKHLLQLFNDFKQNSEKFNILFAITKPKSNRREKFKATKFLSNIKKNLKTFEDRIKSEDYKSNIKNNLSSMENNEIKIKIYQKLINLLNESFDKKKLKEIEDNFPLLKSEENFCILFRDKLTDELEKAKKTKDSIPLTKENWENAIKKLEEEKVKNLAILQESEAEKSMIYLLQKAVEK